MTAHSDKPTNTGGPSSLKIVEDILIRPEILHAHSIKRGLGEDGLLSNMLSQLGTTESEESSSPLVQRVMAELTNSPALNSLPQTSPRTAIPTFSETDDLTLIDFEALSAFFDEAAPYDDPDAEASIALQQVIETSSLMAHQLDQLYQLRWLLASHTHSLMLQAPACWPEIATQLSPEDFTVSDKPSDNVASFNEAKQASQQRQGQKQPSWIEQLDLQRKWQWSAVAAGVVVALVSIPVLNKMIQPSSPSIGVAQLEASQLQNQETGYATLDSRDVLSSDLRAKTVSNRQHIPSAEEYLAVSRQDPTNDDLLIIVGPDEHYEY